MNHILLKLFINFVSLCFLLSSANAASYAKLNKMAIEIQMRDVHYSYIERYGGLFNDPKAAIAVDRVFDRLKDADHFKGKIIHPILLGSNKLYAAALNSRSKHTYIYITIAMLRFIQSEEELAFILAHELGHINLHHERKRSNAQKKQDELSADMLALKYMKIAGYDGKLAIPLFYRLKSVQRNQISLNDDIYPSNDVRLIQIKNKLGE